jgi:hypothetical protein
MRMQRPGVPLVRTLRFGASERGCCLMAFADTFLFAFLFAMHTTVSRCKSIMTCRKLNNLIIGCKHVTSRPPRSSSDQQISFAHALTLVDCAMMSALLARVMT